MAIITHQLVASLRTGFADIFQRALQETPTQYEKVSTVVKSSSASNTYAWLGEFPGLRRWVGNRVIKDIKEHGYQIINDLFEDTVGVRRTDIEDDNVGIYAPRFAQLGQVTRRHADELVFGLLNNGETGICYDGKPFFSDQHPVYANHDGTGTAVNVSNMLTDAQYTGPAWYLLDTSQVLKPLIFQERTEPEFVTHTSVDHESVFMRDEYLYGVRYRCNAGYGFWQMAFKAKAPLTAQNFEQARTAMTSLRADGGRPLGIRPTVLVVPTSLESAANKLIKTQLINGGDSNPNYNAVDIIVSPYLA